MTGQFSQPAYDRIYMAPHLDDAVYSCGGQIWQQVDGGQRVLVVTVFAGVPPADRALSPFARSLHRRWGDLADAARRRQEEDFEALALLGAEGMHWPYSDCIYRWIPGVGFPYDSEESLWSDIHPEEEHLVDDIITRLGGLELAADGTLYGPAGIGHHVDHQIVRRAADRMACDVTYYEDFPYAGEDPDTVRKVLGAGGWDARLTALSEQSLAAKIAAIACYRSQISTFWSDLTELAATVREFALKVGQDQPAERYWYPKECAR